MGLDSVKKSMRSHLPKINVDWKHGSAYTINDYFTKTSKQSKKEKK
jgi:hypothetical protein